MKKNQPFGKKHIVWAITFETFSWKKFSEQSIKWKFGAI